LLLKNSIIVIGCAGLYLGALFVLGTVGIGGPVTARYVVASTSQFLPKNIAGLRPMKRFKSGDCQFIYSTTDSPLLWKTLRINQCRPG
jgi:hypothetical protein